LVTSNNLIVNVLEDLLSWNVKYKQVINNIRKEIRYTFDGRCLRIIHIENVAWTNMIY